MSNPPTFEQLYARAATLAATLTAAGVESIPPLPVSAMAGAEDRENTARRPGSPQRNTAKLEEYIAQCEALRAKAVSPVLAPPPTASTVTGPNGECLLRDDFDRLTPRERLAFSQNGGSIQDGKHTAVQDPQFGPGSKMERGEFERLAPRLQMQFCKAGGQLSAPQ
jgi:hypothetical protein